MVTFRLDLRHPVTSERRRGHLLTPASIWRVLLSTTCLVAAFGLVTLVALQGPGQVGSFEDAMSDRNYGEVTSDRKYGDVKKLISDRNSGDVSNILSDRKLGDHHSGDIVRFRHRNLDEVSVTDWNSRDVTNDVTSLHPSTSDTVSDRKDTLKRPVNADRLSGRRLLLGNTEESPSRSNLTWERRLPGALIIGVKKGGTRALLEFLRLHPDVRAPGPEVHFFDRFYHKGHRWYRSQMPASLSDQLTIEKTPSYFITSEVPSRVRTMSPDTKLVVVVRDPVTRAISDYTQGVSKHTSTRLQSFEDMVFANATSGLLDTTWSALKIGVYVKFLKHWLQHFKLSQMHFVSGEKLVTDPVAELDKVQAFLGLDNLIGVKHFYFNHTKGFPCLKKAEGNGNPHCLGKTKGRTHPRIKNETVQRLADFYRPFNQRFYQMVGRDFGWL